MKTLTGDNLKKQQTERVILTLRNLARIWPKHLWLFSAAGMLCLMEKENGERIMERDGGVSRSAIVTTFPSIENDGGDW